MAPTGRTAFLMCLLMECRVKLLRLDAATCGIAYRAAEGTLAG